MRPVAQNPPTHSRWLGDLIVLSLCCFTENVRTVRRHARLNSQFVFV